MTGKVLDRALGGLGSLLLLGMMVLTLVDVVGRYAFNAPLPGAIELIEILLATLIFAALPRITARGQHITIDLIDMVMPRGFLRMQQAVINSISAVVLAGMSYVVWQHAAGTAAHGIQTDYLGVPMAPVGYFVSAMCFAAFVAACRSVALSLIRN